MAESMSGCTYREISISSSVGTRWKEINVNTGASASTLQDIKVPDSCGGYTYNDSGLSQSSVRNRFIYWKTSKDILELVEQSLDFDLVGSHVMFRFQDTQILDGISITESHDSVVILVATVASVHRLLFPHPVKLQRQDMGYTTSDQPIPSIFLNASIANATDPRNKHMINTAGTMTSQLNCASTFLKNDGEALFAFSSNAGNLLLVKMPPVDKEGGVVQQFELAQSSMMKKLWSGIMRSNQDVSESPTSIVVQPFKGDPYIFTVCRDYKLRIWSANTLECVFVFNMLDLCPEKAQTHPTTCAGHLIRKVLSNDDSNLRFSVYLNFPKGNQFVHIQPDVGRMHVHHIETISGNEDDLIDYCATDDQLLTLLTDKSGECSARIRDERSLNWTEVILQSTESEDLLVPLHRDPREVYIEHIFHPGRFHLQDIRKALNVCRRSLDNISMFDNLGQVNTLKEEVTLAVEDAIRTAASANELAEEDYYQLQLDEWSKFYSCCTQYHEVGSRMTGLLADPVTGMICFIKKGGISYVRQCDKTEELFLGSGQWLEQEENDLQDLSLKDDIRTLSECLQLIDGKLTEDITAQFECQISLKEDVKNLAEQIVDEMFFNTSLIDNSTAADSLAYLLQNIADIQLALKTILQSLDIQQRGGEQDFVMDTSDINANQKLSCERLFISSTGVEILSKSLQQISAIRLIVVRDLLILMVAALRLENKSGLTQASASEIDNELIPNTCVLIKAYMTLKWTTETMATSAQTSSMEFNVRQLASLEIGPGLGSIQFKGGNQNMTITEMFLKGEGGNQVRIKLAKTGCMDEDPCATWTIAVLGLARFTAELLWPMNESFLFPEYLMECCQYLPLQQYVNQLSEFCDVNESSLKFMLGMAYLHFDEPEKAAQCFTEASQGVANEPFLREKIIQSDEVEVRQLEVLYYLKVLKQFEEFGAPDVVVSFAKTAISIADDDDPNVATLWSKVFKYELELEHNEEAYSAMIANPESSRRKDCLRQLLVTLSERGDLQSIVSFPYIDLEDEVVSILESRARSVDLTSQNYYDLLYAFHVNRTNWRKAGSVMYEHAMRLSRECSGKRGLQRQAQCYLAAMNALRLVDSQYAWIVKPVPSAKPKVFLGNYTAYSPKRLYDGIEKQEIMMKKLEIVELGDIEKEFMLVDARLRLYGKESDQGFHSGPISRPDEIVGQLVNVGLYDRAVIISHLFNLKLHTVMESLALRCVNLARSNVGIMATDCYDWLQDNNVTLSCVMQNSSAADMGWSLLQNYLEMYEEKTSQYHRCVAVKLLSHGFPLPTWLVNSFKKINMSELLKIYIDFDLLEDGVLLTMEYIDAIVDSLTGQERTQFGLKGCGTQVSQSSWLPYTYIDQLLLGLKDNRHERIYELYDFLHTKLLHYFRRVETLSDQINQAINIT
ncbi:nuclear pore complex protein Nup160-like isoform X1 [Mytilus californianus]|uniref:nuclear pore complex protein Nup160-like isoform X1 n=1 Tax=Mytilus californianus TaxID=6549 RepID=UPI0022469163|nr:nuclear pore complex protein Nup160-like isoform X1 [Mytilus californianus]